VLLKNGKMKDLKLFIWEDVLSDHTSGIAFALAENVEEAREIILAKGLAEDGYISNTLKSDLTSAHKVVDNKQGFYIWGGG